MLRYLLFVLCLALASCESTRYIPNAVDAKVDSTLRAAGFAPLQAGKIKIAGNVIINTGPGSVSTADNRKAGQRQGAAATAPAASASTTTKKAGTPWYVFGAITLVAAAGGAWARGRFPVLNFLK